MLAIGDAGMAGMNQSRQRKHYRSNTVSRDTHLYRVVPKATNNFIVIILETVDSLAIFALASNPFQLVFASSPVGLNFLQVRNK